MDIPVFPVRSETEVRRSRFITDLEGVADRSRAEELIRFRREQHPGATHVVYAFIVGPEGSQLWGMSDDGEPKGTAGRPVLEILKGSGLTNLLVTVVRYYGGIKLGTGGLVRAYGDALRQGLALVERQPLRFLSCRDITCSYELQNPVRMVLARFGAEIRQEDFSETVRFRVAVDQEKLDALCGELRDVSRGTILIEDSDR
ncbi:IMPACT family protein [Alkalispirochaeta alkalica]|uniref:IMPACT family protein n=1 Tax=Alkalispirochaeta alkalica TaxID=46356 RepID=UPI00038035F9|nr:YigZ family protein [Alkalispirochaeta alkalica]